MFVTKTQVIKNTIHKDYNEASLNLGKATSALYAERIRLIGGSNDRANGNSYREQWLSCMLTQVHVLLVF